ncbi:unnamed protein product [Cylindrotheca closterium]|uniref:Uncharacterized protein n=1 Tax=Cylindrotheca closterium TaxID=2856 RepID=A0AAD2GDL1_9STRA|nr:unnamed protein product [Cylindrotheca closterium]
MSRQKRILGLLVLYCTKDRIFTIAFQDKFYSASRAPIALYSTPPRQPRRLMKKRRRRDRKGKSVESKDFAWETAESRPLVKSIAKEAGQDYWIDPDDLKKERQREEAVKNRNAVEGEVPKEKLMSEIVAPYKQNWIGFFSVFIATLSIIIIKFPELLDQPKILFPDL